MRTVNAYHNRYATHNLPSKELKYFQCIVKTTWKRIHTFHLWRNMNRSCNEQSEELVNLEIEHNYSFEGILSNTHGMLARHTECWESVIRNLSGDFGDIATSKTSGPDFCFATAQI